MPFDHLTAVVDTEYYSGGRILASSPWVDREQQQLLESSKLLCLLRSVDVGADPRAVCHPVQAEAKPGTMVNEEAHPCPPWECLLSTVSYVGSEGARETETLLLWTNSW